MAATRSPRAQFTPDLPPGHDVELPGRGRTWVWEAAGPPGAPTVVLLHGWTATAALNWFTAFGALSDHYRVLAMDVRGHGRGLRRPFSLRGCADDAASLCRTLGAGSVIAVGYSMGGPIAQLLWRRHPDLVAGLVLCATSTYFSRPNSFESAFGLAGRSLALALGMLPAPAQRELARRTFVNRMPPGRLHAWAQQERDRHDVAALVAAGVELRSYDARRWITTVDVPTAVVATTEDQLVSPRRQLAMAQSIPGASLWPVDGDHGVCVGAPRRFVPVLVDAVDDVARRAFSPAPTAP